jgi:hypothetical protein
VAWTLLMSCARAAKSEGRNMLGLLVVAAAATMLLVLLHISIVRASDSASKLASIT